MIDTLREPRFIEEEADSTSPTPVRSERCARCPLHTIMGQIAQTALRQHVLFLEGELLPRVESLQDLEALTALAKLVTARVCVSSRGATRLTEGELARLWTPLSDGGDLRQATIACARSESCPLGE